MRCALFLIAVFALLVFVSCTQVNAQAIDTPPANLTPGAKKIWVKLQTIIIDRFNFERLDLSVILPYLTKQSKELDPEHVGVRIVLQGPYAPPALPPTSGQPIHREASPICDVPLSELLGYLIQQANCNYKITDDAVIVFPAKRQPQAK